MISDISLARDETHLVPLIFLDTLHHFPATLELAQRASERYLADLHTFRPLGKDGKELETAEAFEAQYGPRLWETEEDMYDYLVKVRRLRRRHRLTTDSLEELTVLPCIFPGRALAPGLLDARRPRRLNWPSALARRRACRAADRRGRLDRSHQDQPADRVGL
jgi:hypothetical protein